MHFPLKLMPIELSLPLFFTLITPISYPNLPRWSESFLSFTLSPANSCLQANRYPVASTQCSNIR